MSNDEHKFINEWIEHNTGILTSVYPDLDSNLVVSFLQGIVKERLVNPKAKIHNNYIHKEIDVDLLGVIDWIDRTKPIVAGYGVFFKNQEEAINPAAVMLDKFMTLRKKYKAKLKEFDEGSYEYQTADRMQGGEKVNSNSYYGASGASTSNFFNIYTATSVTATGQSLISTTEQAFEAFLTNSVLFSDLDECMFFFENIRKEKHKLDSGFLPNVSVEKMIAHVIDSFEDYKPEYEQFLFNYFMNQSQEILNRMYFKNNIYAFSYLPKIRYKLTDILLKVEEFKDPNKIPDNATGEFQDLWSYYREFVFYNYSVFNRIQRLKTRKRKTVVVVDTDSNMLGLNPWLLFMYRYIVSTNDKINTRDPDQLRYICVNIVAFLITNMIKDVLKKYTKKANILKAYRPKINMKNEFLFTRIALSSSKKRYISSVRLREGKEILPEKVDVKGMDFVKSSTREETKEYFMNLVKEKLLYVKDINIADVLRSLEDFEDIITESIKKGERSFLIPKSVKELGAYSDPFKEQGVRAVITWNYLYPDNPIELPAKIDIVKVLLRTEDELEKLKSVNENYYSIIKKNIFENPEKKISSKGVQIIALPRNVQSIPEWMISFIDVDTIVNDNLHRFYSVLESLGIKTLKTSKKEYFTNILKI